MAGPVRITVRKYACRCGCAGCSWPSDSSSETSDHTGRGAGCKWGASQLPQAGVGRVIFGPFCMRRRSHESCRFRMVGACPDAAFRSAQPLHSCARDTDQLVGLALYLVFQTRLRKKIRSPNHRIALCCLLSSRYHANHAMRSRLRLRMASACIWSGHPG